MMHYKTLSGRNVARVIKIFRTQVRQVQQFLRRHKRVLWLVLLAVMLVAQFCTEDGLVIPAQELVIDLADLLPAQHCPPCHCPRTIVGGDYGLVQMPTIAAHKITTHELLSVNIQAHAALKLHMMRTHMHLVCKDLENIDSELVEVLKISDKEPLYIHKYNDAVSTSLRHGHSWHPEITSELMWALTNITVPGLQNLFVDVGASVGWYTFAAARAGSRVYAFEASSATFRILQQSLCENPSLLNQVTLVGVALGKKAEACKTVSASNDQYNLLVVCNPQQPNQVAETLTGLREVDYQVREEINTWPLGDLVDEDIKVLKLSAPGSENDVLKGAATLFKNRRVWFVITHLDLDFLEIQDAMAYIKFFVDKHKYQCSFYSFKGPYINDDVTNQSLDMNWHARTLFCTHRDISHLGK